MPWQVRTNSNISALQQTDMNRNREEITDISVQKTRNNKIQQQSNTETIENKIESLNWVCDQKNYTNDLQNYLTEFKDLQTFSSELSSRGIRSPSCQLGEPFENYNIADYSAKILPSCDSGKNDIKQNSKFHPNINLPKKEIVHPPIGIFQK